ncbi:cadherin-related family member 5-like isoform X1 [Lampris incognitus]|uniref:cadherin-related family member 5-like isoform X1 n=1 Tax=Lampris incognitus TaxID=2546036 RepID=UPI0024B526FB|nr:cadherin-related family member 5-like isoform X1 [Lampris incognitus]
MERICCKVAVRIWQIFSLILLLQTSTQAQQICSSPASVAIPENNTIGDVILTIQTSEGVTLSLKENPNNLFMISRNQLKANATLDYETAKTHVVEITCNQMSTGTLLNIVAVIVVTNINDNPPVFSRSQYHLNVLEMLPVDTPLETYKAIDLDADTILYYTLLPEQGWFKLKTPNIPTILVQKPIDYDTIKNVKLTLFARDTPTPTPTSFTATTTILVTIMDADNRPPWFQPCTLYTNGGAKICQGAGYTGSVVLTEQTVGVLPLEPGPIYAIDGDSGINERITYSFLRGNEAGLFDINANTGNITMRKPADISGPINLTVLASQMMNSFQFATTMVTIKVLPKSLHPPQFERKQYDGFVSGVGIMVLDLNNKTQPLWIKAKDEDFAEGENPAIRYNILGSSAFSLIGGYLFMTQDTSPGMVSLQVEAVDTSNKESAKVDLAVEVSSGLPTTTVAPSTTDMASTTPIEMTTGRTTETSETVPTTTPNLTTTNSGLTTNTGLSTTNPIQSTTDPILTRTYSSPSTTSNPSMTTQGSFSTASTAHPYTEGGRLGGYGAEDMAALGATLGVLLFIALVVIGLLVYCIQKGKADWQKITEASTFQSSLGQGSGGWKEGVQYTNEGFHNDEDSGSMSSGELKTKLGIGLAPRAVGVPNEGAILRSTAPLHMLLPDDTSLAGSDKAESEKEVKPILTKERRVDEGYKSVWFKEDIDPEAKEEVVIIQDNGQRDREDEEEGLSSGRDEEDDDNSPGKTQNIFFADSDMDSGLGVQIRDPSADSEDDEMSTADL